LVRQTSQISNDIRGSFFLFRSFFLFVERNELAQVGPRDGLQNEREILPTDVKIKLIDRLVGAGLKFVETTSFVSPKEIPQMSDAAELMKRLKKQPGVSYPVLVPNDKGFQNAINAGATDLAVFVAGSETFSQKNNKCPISVSLDRARSICEKAKAMNIKVRGYLSCVLGCPYEGYMNPAGIADLAEKLLQMGCYQVSLGDTIGVGSPGTTHRLLSEVSKKIDVEKIAVHFHDTYGQALANILTSLQFGVRTVDSSVAGLGGCPFAMGATGNVATEDVLYMLSGLGIVTGVSLEALVEVGDYISKHLRRPSHSRTGKALVAKKEKLMKQEASARKPPHVEVTTEQSGG
jgi:hydroxymethylglutaryl-CoA lyase